MRRIALPILFVFIVLVTCKKSETPPARVQSPIDSIITAFESKIEAGLKADSLNGCISIAITKDNQLIWSKALGYSDPATKVMPDTNTIFRAGSITKSFTALLMLQLAEAGKLNFNDPAERYLPEIKKLKGYPIKNPITLLQLATHTSGLAREPELDGAVIGPISDWESKLLKCIPATKVDTIPGTKFNYSNIGFGILGLTLSRAAGKPYIELVEEQILKPLHMDRSFFVVPEALSASIATGMNGAPGDSVDVTRPRTDFAGRGYKVPNGGLFCTPSDLSKFLRCLGGHSSIVKQASLDQMERGYPPTGGYGMGVGVTDEEGMMIVGHGGAVPGYTASAAFDKNSGYGVVLMRNYNDGASNLDEAVGKLLFDLSRTKKN